MYNYRVFISIIVKLRPLLIYSESYQLSRVYFFIVFLFACPSLYARTWLLTKFFILWDPKFFPTPYPVSLFWGAFRCDYHLFWLCVTRCIRGTSPLLHSRHHSCLPWNPSTQLSFESRFMTSGCSSLRNVLRTYIYYLSWHYPFVTIALQESPLSVFMPQSEQSIL